MRHVVFCAPFLGARATLRFLRALRELPEVHLCAVCQEPPPEEARVMLDGLEVVPSVLHAGQLFDGVERLRHRVGPPDRLIGILEDLQVPLAHVRNHYDLPGESVEAAVRFRDKGLMKDALREHGIPCAKYRRLTSDADALEFVEQVGLPIIVKPPAGAGSRSTFALRSQTELAAALAQMHLSEHQPMLAEEFLTGAEYSFETLCVNGEPLFHSIGRYYPGPLEVMRTSWIQWVCVLPRDISGTEFDDARQVGLSAVRKLGMTHGLTHMEWFRRDDGTIAVGEIAMRPPGAQFVTLMSWAHDADLYQAWARALVDHAFDGPFERQHAVACAYLRGDGPGSKVAHVSGVGAIKRELGDLIVEAHLPTIGAPRSTSYEGDGFVVVRHSDTEVVREASTRIIERVHVSYT